MTSEPSDYLKSIVETILFISEKPVTLEQLKEVSGTTGTAEIRQAVQDLMREYEDNRRGMIVTEIAGGYQMLSSPHLANYVRNFFKRHVKEKLSRPALETLAIIAYKQPVTRGDIELIRGVNSDGVMGLLLNKGLVKIVGRKDIPGRPYLHGTTKLFLEYFGLKSLQDLPRLEEFPALMTRAEEEVVNLHAHESVAAEPPTEDGNAEPAAPEGPTSSDEEEPGGVPAGAGAAQPEEAAPDLASIQAPAQGQCTWEDTTCPAPGDESDQTAVEDVEELKQAMDDFNRGERDGDEAGPPPAEGH